jgi:hypothetical protein
MGSGEFIVGTFEVGFDGVKGEVVEFDQAAGEVGVAASVEEIGAGVPSGSVFGAPQSFIET